MKISIAQLNPKIGDFEGNSKKIIAFCHKARTDGAELVVFPELAVCGYPPMDLLDFKKFIDLNQEYLSRIAQSIPSDLPAVIGWVSRAEDSSRKLHNSASILLGGKEVFRQAKTLLPNYDIFDELRYFSSAETQEVWTYKDKKFGILLCEDLWFHEPVPTRQVYPVDPLEKLIQKGANVVLGCSASPFTHPKQFQRVQILQEASKMHQIPILYANQVGANDGIVFDGKSFAVNSQGALIFSAPSFEEGVYSFTLNQTPIPYGETQFEDETLKALITGTRDYILKSGFQKAHLGLSGGIDSAIVLWIAVQALGAENVLALSMPSRYSSPGSITDSVELARTLGVKLEILSIEEPFEAYLSTLNTAWSGAFKGLAVENIQARIRGNYLMAYSNISGSLLLTTGNKSELSTGYCTLYGDMAGALAVIGDVFKTDVFRLTRWINRNKEIIPANILEKPPSAELRENQKDEDSLPPYEILDSILKQYIFEHKTLGEISGSDPATVAKILLMVAKSEHKRFQAPPVVKVSEKAFGIGRRHPIARAYIENIS